MQDQLIKVYAISVPGENASYNRDNIYMNGKYIMNEQKSEPFSYCSSSRQQIQIYAVCDGTGDGEEASVPPTAVMQVLKVLHRRLVEERRIGIDKAIRMIDDFIQDTNNKIEIYKQSVKLSELKTSFTALFIFGNKAFTVHVGDSRVYLYRGNQLHQLSEDHLECTSMVKMGVLNKEQAEVHRVNSKLTRYFGFEDEEEELVADFSEVFEIGQGDIFLFTTDGMTDYTSNREMERIIQESNKDEVVLGKALFTKNLSSLGDHDRTLMVLNVDEVMDKSLIHEQEDDDSAVIRVKKDKPKKDKKKKQNHDPDEKAKYVNEPKVVTLQDLVKEKAKSVESQQEPIEIQKEAQQKNQQEPKEEVIQEKKQEATVNLENLKKEKLLKQQQAKMQQQSAQAKETKRNKEQEDLEELSRIRAAQLKENQRLQEINMEEVMAIHNGEDSKPTPIKQYLKEEQPVIKEVIKEPKKINKPKKATDPDKADQIEKAKEDQDKENQDHQSDQQKDSQAKEVPKGALGQVAEEAPRDIPEWEEPNQDEFYEGEKGGSKSKIWIIIALAVLALAVVIGFMAIKNKKANVDTKPKPAVSEEQKDLPDTEIVPDQPLTQPGDKVEDGDTTDKEQTGDEQQQETNPEEQDQAQNPEPDTDTSTEQPPLDEVQIEIQPTYLVQAGDNLYRIVKTYYTSYSLDVYSTVRKLKYINNMDLESNDIQADTTINMVPANGVIEYVVEPGDTITSIVKKFYDQNPASTQVELKRLNGFADDAVIQVGQKVLLP